MAGVAHSFALASAEGIDLEAFAAFAQGIGRLLPESITRLAEQIRADDFPGDRSTIASAASGINHIVNAAAAHGIDVGVLTAAKAVIDRAVADGHGRTGGGLAAGRRGHGGGRYRSPVGAVRRGHPSGRRSRLAASRDRTMYTCARPACSASNARTRGAFSRRYPQTWWMKPQVSAATSCSWMAANLSQGKFVPFVVVDGVQMGDLCADEGGNAAPDGGLAGPVTAGDRNFFSGCAVWAPQRSTVPASG